MSAEREEMPVADQGVGRFQVVVEQGPPHGDLYELEQTTYYHVVDGQTQKVVMTFRSELEAELGRGSGLWENYRLSGVRDVSMAPDELSVIVSYEDGRVESVPLPY